MYPSWVAVVSNLDLRGTTRHLLSPALAWKRHYSSGGCCHSEVWADGLSSEYTRETDDRRPYITQYSASRDAMDTGGIAGSVFLYDSPARASPN